MDRNVIVMRKDGITLWSNLNISVVVSLFFLSIFQCVLAIFFTQMTKESLSLRLDLYLCSLYVLYSLREHVNLPLTFLLTPT